VFNTIGDKGYEQDIVMRQGALFSYDVELKNNDDTPVDLTGCSVHAKIRKNLFNGTVYTITTTITDAVNGEFTFSLTSDQTMEIMAGGSECDPSSQYQWNMDITYSNGEIRPLFYGKIFVVAAIE